MSDHFTQEITLNELTQIVLVSVLIGTAFIIGAILGRTMNCTPVDQRSVAVERDYYKDELRKLEAKRWERK